MQQPSRRVPGATRRAARAALPRASSAGEDRSASRCRTDRLNIVRASRARAAGSCNRARVTDVAEQWAEVLDEHRARQRRQIMAVALELVAERGLAGVSMSALAQRAGISRATLYHYFPDLEQVLLAWVGEEVDTFVAELARELTSQDDPVVQLRRIVAAHVHAFSGAEHRFGADLLKGDALSPKVREEVGRHLAGLRELVADVLAAGRRAECFGPLASDPLAVDAVVSLLGALRPHLLAGTAAPEDVSEFLTGLLAHGLAGDVRGDVQSSRATVGAATGRGSTGAGPGGVAPGAARTTGPGPGVGAARRGWSAGDD